MRLTMVLQCRWRGGKAADQLQAKERARPQVDEREYQYEGGARPCGGEMAKLNRRSSTGAAVDVNNGAGSRGGDDEAQKRAAVNAMREKLDVQNSHLLPRSTGRAAHERWCVASVVRAVVAGGDRARVRQRERESEPCSRAQRALTIHAAFGAWRLKVVVL